MFDFKNGFKYNSNERFTSSLFNGLLLASSKSRSYTFPSYDPNAESNISSRMSKLSTRPTAFGLIRFKLSSSKVCIESTSLFFRFEY